MLLKVYLTGMEQLIIDAKLTQVTDKIINAKLI
jgi:hypothetical protein